MLILPKVYVGNDLVYVPDFARQLDEPRFVQRVFTQKELAQDVGAEHLAGIFAAKEAFFKATQLSMKEWSEIEVTREHGGKPRLVYDADKVPVKVLSLDVSITHTREYAMATCVVLWEELDAEKVRSMRKKTSFRKQDMQ